MESHWVNHRPGYRCRHGHTSARQPDAHRPRNLYLREDHVLNELTKTYGHTGEPDELIAYLHGQQITIPFEPDPTTSSRSQHDRPPNTLRRM
jgi:hypothetical protein